MKRIAIALGVLGLIGCSLLLGRENVAAQSSSLWKFVGNLRPVNSWRVDAPGGASGSSLTVSNLRNCDTIDTNASGVLSCGTDSSGGAASITGGQGITVSGSVVRLNATISGSLVRFETVSGSTVYAKNRLTTSGSLKVLGNMSGASLNLNSLISCENVQTSAAGALSCNATDYITETELDTVAELETQITDVDTFYTEDTTVPVVDGGTGVASCTDGGFITGNGTNALTCNAILTDNQIYIGDGTTEPTATAIPECSASQKLQYTDSGNGLTCVADVDTTYIAAQGLGLSGGAFSLNTTISGSLLEFQTVSGAIVHAQSQLRSSGSLVVEGATTLANTQSCTMLQSSSTGLLSCQNSYAGQTSIVTTGTVTTGTWDATTVAVTAGGTGFESCTDGGFVTGNGSATLTCNAVLTDDQVYIGDGTTEPTATTLPSCSAAGDTLNYNASTNAWACGSDADTTYTAGQGLTLAGTVLSLSTSHSGSLIRATTTLASSGTLSVENNAAIQGVLTLTNALTVANGGTALTSLPTRTVVLTAGGGLPSALTGSGASGPERWTGSTNDTSLYVLEYGNTSKPRYSMWTATMPDNYDGGTMTFKFNWVTAATSGDVKWFVQCRSLGDAEAIDQSWGTAQSVTDTAGTTNTLRITSATAAVTCAGTPAGGELIQFRVYRDAADAADSLTDTGALISVKGEYLTNSYTD